MQVYKVNFHKLVIWLLPISWRKSKLIAYLISLIHPIKKLYVDFLFFRKQQLYEATINGQVINLERVLNDTFDPIDRRIFITDGEYFEPPTFLEEWKNQPVVFHEEGHLNNPIFYSIDSIGNRVDFNFYVNIPNAVWHDRQRVRALVNKYKIFGRTFNIIEI